MTGWMGAQLRAAVAPVTASGPWADVSDAREREWRIEDLEYQERRCGLTDDERAELAELRAEQGES